MLFLLSFVVPTYAVEKPAAEEHLDDLQFLEPFPVPDIEFITGNGDKITLAHFAGKPVILNFWATWCIPCIEEMPTLNRLHKLLEGDGIEVVTISEDFKGISVAKQFLERHKLSNLTPYADINTRLLNEFKIDGLPATVFINADGEVIARVSGTEVWDAPEIQAFIRGIFNK